MSFLRTLLKRSNRNLRKGESVEDALATITHIHMAESNLTKLENMNLFPSAICLYCYDNQIESLDGVEQLDLLEELQAQHNEISEIPELGPFVLRKLDLRHNKIGTITGLSQQPDIHELFLSYQRVDRVILPEGCLASQCLSLEVLEMASCGLEDLTELRWLENLRELNLSNNKINSFDQLRALFSKLRNLDKVDLRDNPICREVKYREKVIIMGKFYELDGKEILNTQREMLFRMAQRKSTKTPGKKDQSQKESNPLSIQKLD